MGNDGPRLNTTEAINGADHDAAAVAINMAVLCAQESALYARAGDHGPAIRYANAATRASDAYRAGRTAHKDRRFRYTALIGTWILLIALALTVMCCAARPKNLSPIPERVEQMQRAVELRVVCGNFDAAITSGDVTIDGQAGSGVIVGPHTIITAAHVPECHDENKKPDGRASVVYAKLGGMWSAVTVARSYAPARDIAELYVERDTGYKSIEFRSSVMEHESVCAAFAYPMAHYDCGPFKYHRTTMEGINGVLGIPVVSGNSGSGLFDRQGRLVGIVTAQTLCHVDITVTHEPDGTPVYEPKMIGGSDCDGLASMLDNVVLP